MRMGMGGVWGEEAVAAVAVKCSRADNIPGAAS